MKTLTQSQQISAGITFLVCLYILLMLLLTKMSWNPVLDVPAPHTYIAMEAPEEEFIEVEVLDPVPNGEEAAPALTPEELNNEAQPAPPTGVNLSTQGKPDQPVHEVTQKTPSPIKEVQQPTKPHPAAAVTNQKEQEEKATAQRTQSAVNNAFANAKNKNNAVNGTNDNGNAGKTTGDVTSAGGTSSGVSSGTVGGGWKMPLYSRNIQSNEIGSVTFEVVVNSDGSVGKITQIANNGLTSATVAKCRAEIQRHKFTHQTPAEAQPATARVKFTFQDPR